MVVQSRRRRRRRAGATTRPARHDGESPHGRRGHTALHSLIERLVHATDDEEKRRLYAEWATRYDGDLDEFGYVAPGIALERFERHVPDRSARVYDAGCGTGRVGALIGALLARGAVDVLSLESAPYMLAQRATAWYTCLRRRARGR